VVRRGIVVVSQGYDFGRLAIAASQEDASPGYAPKGDQIDKSMARQEHDKNMARAWQEHGKNMARTWQEQGKNHASVGIDMVVFPYYCQDRALIGHPHAGVCNVIATTVSPFS
jgi:hypothetical protein